MPISIVIPSVRATHLGATLASICRQTCPDWELIVVAQGDDPELKALREADYPDSRVRFIHLQKRGLSHARNAGIEAATHPLVLFTDDDCEAQEDWVSVTMECFETYPNVWLVGGALVAPPRPRWKIASCPKVLPQEVVYDPATTFGKPPVGWGWVGGNFAIRREVYSRIGPFDTFLGAGAYFPVAEEVDLGFRLERARMPMLSTHRSVVHHTYGTRYGLRSILRTSINYARGNGAMAAKLTLQEDPRGAEWVATTRKLARPWNNLRRAYRLPGTIWRVNVFEQAYRECLREFCVDANGLLQRRGF